MKKLLIAFFIIVFCPDQTFSQNTKIIDSLKTELKKESINDSIKVVILTMLHENLMFSEPEEAKEYAEQEIEIYKRTGSEFANGLGNLHLGDYYFNKSMNDSALHHYDIAKYSFLKNNKTRGLVFVNFTIGDIHKSMGNYEKALTIFTSSLDEIEKNISDEPYKSQFLASSHLSIGSCYFEKGNLNLALRESLKALDYYEKINDELRRADTYKQLGDIEKELNHTQSSITYYKNASELYQANNDNIYEASTVSALGETFLSIGDLSNAQANFNKAIEISREYELMEPLSNALMNQGILFMKKEDFLAARASLLESLAIAKKERLNLQMIYSYQAISELELKESQYNNSMNAVNTAIELAEANGSLIALNELYELKSRVLENTGEDQQAIKFLKDSWKFKDSISSVKKVRQIEELKTIYETEKKEAEIALKEEEINTLNEKAKVDKLTKGLYAGGMASALALFGLSVFGYRQRIKRSRIAREKQEEIYKQEIAHKKKELASQTLHLVQKNTFIQELKENLENLKNSPEKFKVEFRRIVMLLKKQNASDKDWEVFKSYFSEVHNDFDQKLKTLYPDISEKEIRLAAFLRMNLTTKEIAATLNVLPDSILKSKYRLKKKLGLDKDIDLTSFLNTL